MADTIYSLSLSARAQLNMHSLNNEGSEGNQLQTRMVDVYHDGRLHTVNGISGDMFKHIFTEHLQRIAVAQGLPLCAGCRQMNANRINADKSFEELVKDKSVKDAPVLDALIQRCVVDDIAGNLITLANRSIPRKSIVEFGWVLGVPGEVRTDSYFHVKYVNERSEGERADVKGDEVRGGNLGQNIFHRPASSGVYAVVVHVELGRIGRNDSTRKYAIDEAERTVRARAVLEALLYTFIQPTGAMRGTQLPHVAGFEGALTISRGIAPAPMTSPLNAAYVNDIERIIASLNGLHQDTLELKRFESMADYSEILRTLADSAQAFRLE